MLCIQGSARMIRCLQDTRSSLSKECQASLFDQEVKMAEDIDFKFPLKMACTSEIQTYCADVQHGHANVIRFVLNPLMQQLANLRITCTR